MTRRDLVLKLLAILVPVLIFLIAFFGLYVWRVSQDPFKRTDLRYEGDWPLQADPNLGFVGLYNGSSHMRKLKLGLSYSLYTDGQGARVNTATETAAEQLEIITIGGSCAYGYGLDNEDTFSHRLALALKVTVGNYAQVGYSTLQSLIMLRRHLDQNPRVVIYGYIDDHLDRNFSPCAPSGAPYCLPAPYLVESQTSGFEERPPKMGLFTPADNWRYYREILTTDRPYWRDVTWRMKIDLFQIKTSSELRLVATDEQKRAGLAYLLGEMGKDCRSRGVALVVMFIPYLNRAEVNGPHPALLSALNEDMLFLDLTKAVKTYQSDHAEPLGFPGDGHPNKKANALIARELTRILKEQQLFPNPK